MMLKWDDQPLEIRNFRDFLRSCAGDLVVERSEGVANQLLRGCLDELQLKLVADRSVWFFSIARPGEDYFDLEYWLHCVYGEQGLPTDSSLSDLTGRLQSLLSSRAIEQVELSCLEAVRDAVASRYN